MKKINLLLILSSILIGGEGYTASGQPPRGGGEAFINILRSLQGSDNEEIDDTASVLLNFGEEGDVSAHPINVPNELFFSSDQGTNNEDNSNQRLNHRQNMLRSLISGQQGSEEMDAAASILINFEEGGDVSTHLINVPNELSFSSDQETNNEDNSIDKDNDDDNDDDNNQKLKLPLDTDSEHNENTRETRNYVDYILRNRKLPSAPDELRSPGLINGPGNRIVFIPMGMENDDDEFQNVEYRYGSNASIRNSNSNPIRMVRYSFPREQDPLNTAIIILPANVLNSKEKKKIKKDSRGIKTIGETVFDLRIDNWLTVIRTGEFNAISRGENRQSHIVIDGNEVEIFLVAGNVNGDMAEEIINILNRYGRSDVVKKLREGNFLSQEDVKSSKRGRRGRR